jgi:hypothetical protein
MGAEPSVDDISVRAEKAARATPAGPPHPQAPPPAPPRPPSASRGVAEIQRLRTENTVLRERLRAMVAVARERTERIEDLRLLVSAMTEFARSRELPTVSETYPAVTSEVVAEQQSERVEPVAAREGGWEAGSPDTREAELRALLTEPDDASRRQGRSGRRRRRFRRRRRT